MHPPCKMARDQFSGRVRLLHILQTRPVLESIHFWYWRRVSMDKKAPHGCILPVLLEQESTTCILQQLRTVHACLQRRWCVHGCIEHVSAFSQESLSPPPLPLPPSVCASYLDSELGTSCGEKTETHQRTQWLLIKSQTAMSCNAPTGLGSRKERARLDRCCFLAARLRGWG